MRKPVGVSTVVVEGQPQAMGGDPRQTIVVCDDGSTWFLQSPFLAWVELPPVPGTPQDEEAGIKG